MPSKQSQRALDFMRCVLPEQRRCSRVHLPIQATVVFKALGNQSHLAFLRDVNMFGAFCYCGLQPSVGDHARLIFELPDDGEQMRATCEGIVVRVEHSPPGAATGLAIEFLRYGVTRVPKTEQPEHHPADAPFINWTVEMVERIFCEVASIDTSQSGMRTGSVKNNSHHP
ncbi:MAG TPA: PilZ domain-containing protein [Terriglobales bacterium]|nr:PilZ domain-containing protein [Terriglobales bacterium]